MNKQRVCSTLAVTILVGASLNEIGRIVYGAPWPHVVTPFQSYFIGSVFSAVWLATAASLLLRERSDTWFSASLFGGLASVALMFFHGAVLRVIGNHLPFLFAPLAVVLAICIKQSFDPAAISAYRERMTRRAHPSA
jgi:hypothetical protein